MKHELYMESYTTPYNEAQIGFSRGDLLFGADYGHRCLIDEIAAHTKTCCVCYDGSLDELKKAVATSYEGRMPFYRTVKPDDIVTGTQAEYTDFYPTMDEANADAVARGWKDVDDWYIVTGILHPVRYTPVKLPIEVYLQLGKRGLFCNINLHPEIDGPRRGKYYFPSKKCKNQLCAGDAIVTAVEDRGTYGFFTAEMKKLPEVDEDAFCDWILKVFDYGMYGVCRSTVLQIVKCPLGDRVFMLSTKTGEREDDMPDEWVITRLGDAICAMSSPMRHFPEQKTVISEQNLLDYWCEHVYGLDQKGMHDKFVKVNSSGSYAVASNTYLQSNESWLSDLLLSVKDTGIIDCYKAFNANFISVKISGIFSLIRYFSDEEIDQIVTEINEINTKANKDIFGKK